MFFFQFFFRLAYFEEQKLEKYRQNLYLCPIRSHINNETAMIIDNLANAANYFHLHPLFGEAFEYLKQIDIKAMHTGTTEIKGSLLKASVVETQLKPEAEARLETHRKYIDIQIPVSGAERYGWRSLSSLTNSETGYDEANDIEFFCERPSTLVTLYPGEFVIFSPEDGHAPLVGEGLIKKIILKIAVR